MPSPSQGDGVRDAAEVPMDDRLRFEIARTLTNAELFSRRALRRPLRGYQIGPAQAIVDAVLQRRGMTFAVMMSRQAGKNETAAQVEALLLNLHRRRGGCIVKASPTFRPQAMNSLMRLQEVLEGSVLPAATVESGGTVRLGRAMARFFSANAAANVVGATASILLEADEAQDVDEEKWDKDFRPMASSTNATTVLWGTAWTPDTLLARTIRELRWAEGKDQIQRVFMVPWQAVAEVVPSYGAYVRGEIARLGRDHPLIKTQYLLEEIASGGGMFPAGVRALMQGRHLRQRQPDNGRLRTALLVDVAGEAEDRLEGEALRQREPRRDSTAVTVVAMDPYPAGTRYLVRDRRWWTGKPHYQLYAAIARLAEIWSAAHVVVDATGVGAGLTSFLKRHLGERVVPVQFTAAVKSRLGWGFLGLCQSGRYLEYADDGADDTAQFWREIVAADYVVGSGPEQPMRWGVADPAIHDDLLLSAALCAVLEEQAAAPHDGSQVVEAADPLAPKEERET